VQEQPLHDGACAVVFDLGQVLVTMSPEYAQRLGAFDLTVEGAFAEIFSGPDALENQFSGRLFTSADMLPLVAAPLEGRLGDRAYEAAQAILSVYTDPGIMRETPGMDSLVERLATSGIPVGVLTNGPADVERTFPILTDSRLVQATVIAGRDGVAKPTSKAFQLVAERLGVPHRECVFIDDSAHNVAAAEALGMTGVVFDGDTDHLTASLAELGLPSN
jgi:HAD superfamily hydrolase (TIGR01509 family)